MNDFEDFRIGAGSLTVDGQDVGHTTEDGVVVNVEPSVHMHMSGKYGTTPVKGSVIGYNVTLQVTMAESTLQNMSKAIAGAEYNTNHLGLGFSGSKPITPVELVLTPFDGSPEWTFHRAIPTSSVELAYQVENERVVQVTFTALVDETEADDANIAFAS